MVSNEKDFCFIRGGLFLWASKMVAFLLIFVSLSTNCKLIADFVVYRFFEVGT